LNGDVTVAAAKSNEAAVSRLASTPKLNWQFYQAIPFPYFVEDHSDMRFQEGNPPTAFAADLMGADPLKEVVSRGPAIVSVLLEHLDDQTPLGAVGEFPNAMRARWQFDANLNATHLQPGTKLEGVGKRFGAQPPTQWTVGDLCFVALGQIVNRSYLSKLVFGSSRVEHNDLGTGSPIIEYARKEWGGLTKERLLQSLRSDIDHPDSSERLSGAIRRLHFYFPQEFDQIVVAKIADFGSADAVSKNVTMLRTMIEACHDVRSKPFDSAVQSLYQTIVTTRNDSQTTLNLALDCLDKIKADTPQPKTSRGHDGAPLFVNPPRYPIFPPKNKVEALYPTNVTPP